MRTRDVEVLAEAYSAIKEASLTTGNVPGQTQYNPHNVSPALKAAGQRVRQGIGQIGNAISNPSASLAAGQAYAQTAGKNIAGALQGSNEAPQNPAQAGLDAFATREYNQALNTLLKVFKLKPDQIKDLDRAVKEVAYPQPTKGYIPRPWASRPTYTSDGPVYPAQSPTTPSKIAVRPK